MCCGRVEEFLYGLGYVIFDCMVFIFGVLEKDFVGFIFYLLGVLVGEGVLG